MASNEKLIRIILKLEDKMSKELDNSANKLKKLGSQMTSVGRNMTMGLTLPIVGLGTAMFKTFADYDAVMTEIQARTQASAEDMELLGKKAIEMGRDTMFGAKDAAEAMLQLTASGNSAAETMEMIDEVLDMAAAGSMGLGQAADSLTDIMKMFGLTAEDTRYIVDSLTKASGSSSATLQDMTEAFVEAGTVAKNYGMTVEETAASLAVLAESGIKGSRAGTAMRSMLTNMSRDTAKARGAWVQLGTSMYDAQGQMRNIDDIFDDINAAMQNMSMEEQNQITHDLAGTYGMLAFNALRSADGIDTMQASMSNASDASTVADAKMNTLAGRFEEMMGSLETLAIVMGGLGEGPLTDLINWVTKTINAFTEWAEANPKLAQTLMIVVAAIAALGPIVWIVGSVITAVSTLIPVFTAIGGVIAGLSLPVLLLVAAFAALFQAINMWNQSGATETWANNFSMAGQIIEKTVQKTGNALSTGVSTWEQNIKNMGTIASQLAEKFKVVAAQLSVGFIAKLKELIPIVKTIAVNIMVGLINGIKSKMAEWFSTIKEMALNAAKMVKDVFKIRSPSRVMMDMGQQVVAGFNQGIESMGGIGVNVPQVGGGGSANPSIGYGGGGSQVFNIYPPEGTSQQQAEYTMRFIARKSKLKGARGLI